MADDGISNEKKEFRSMKRRDLMFASGIVLVFILGVICGVHFASTMRTLRLIERTEIRDNCTDIRRSLFHLELLRKQDYPKLGESLEWDLDESLLALNQYMDGDPGLSKFDEYSMDSLAMADSHRKIYPRVTKAQNTDKIVAAILSNPLIRKIREAR